MYARALAAVVIWLILLVPLIAIGKRSRRKALFIVAALIGLIPAGCVGALVGCSMGFEGPGVPGFPDDFMLGYVLLGAMFGALSGAYVGFVGGAVVAGALALKEGRSDRGDPQTHVADG